MNSEGSSGDRPAGVGEVGGKRSRGAQLSPAQREIIEQCVREEGLGYKAILRKFPTYGFTEQGLKSAVERLRNTGTLDRKEGSGRKRSRRTPDAVEAARQFFAENKTASMGDLRKALELPRTAARRIIREDLELKPLRQVTAQRVKPANAAKRLEACQLWDTQLRSGELDAEKIFFTDEKLFRLGACPGGNQNFVVYVHKETKKYDLPNELVLREDGQWQGGVSVMVCLGLSYRGKGALHFVPAGTKVNSAEYLNIIKTRYEPDIYNLYGVRPDCVFQQDGASSHTANAVQDYCRSKFPKFWGKNSWPPNSPDLNPLDYFCWGYLQQEVTKKKPKCLDSLKLAIWQSSLTIPEEMVKRAISGFPKRVRHCVASGGGPFKHRKLEDSDDLVEYPILSGRGDETDHDDE